MRNMILADYIVSLSGTLLDAVQTIDHNHSRCSIVTEGDKVVGILDRKSTRLNSSHT